MSQTDTHPLHDKRPERVIIPLPAKTLALYREAAAKIADVYDRAPSPEELIAWSLERENSNVIAAEFGDWNDLSQSHRPLKSATRRKAA